MFRKMRRFKQQLTDDPNYADDEIAKVGKNVLCIEITPDHMTGKLVNEA